MMAVKLLSVNIFIMKRVLILAALWAGFLTSCKKETESQYNSNVKAELSVEFDNIAGSSDLELNSGTYTNAGGERFTVSKLKYYVSNFVLTKSDGAVYTVPQDSCYFLIDEEDEATHEPLLKVPEGEYKTLQFTVGVDSIRNTTDISGRTGNLDPTAAGADMYWTWNSGYIFFKIEGKSTASTLPDSAFAYHIGGFGGYSSATINNIRNITLDLTVRGVPRIKAGKPTNIHLMVDIMKLFAGSTNLSIAAHPVVMFDPFSVNIADNYTTMFRHDHTEN